MPDDVNSGGEFPKDSGLEARMSAVEARLARVEIAVDEIRTELKALRADMTGLRLDLTEMRAEMRGRLTNIPTTFQLIYMQSAFVAAIFAAAFALLKLAPPH
jgi:uncharacterized coiled-coil protein SlyX